MGWASGHSQRSGGVSIGLAMSSAIPLVVIRSAFYSPSNADTPIPPVAEEKLRYSRSKAEMASNSLRIAHGVAIPLVVERSIPSVVIRPLAIPAL